MGTWVRGRMWRVICDITGGRKSKPFNIRKSRVARGCSTCMLPLSDEVEKAGIGITVKKDVKVGGLMFPDDFAGLTTNAENLQTLINAVQ